MTQSEGTAPKKKFKKWQIVLVGFIALLVIGQLFGSDKSSTSSSSSSPTTTESTAVDIMTKRSCRDWYTQISEGAKGVQTDEERIAGFREVYDVARYSTDADIADAATKQLAALIAGDVDAFSVAATNFGNACKTHGQ
jgi:hypothetical protein